MARLDSAELSLVLLIILAATHVDGLSTATRNSSIVMQQYTKSSLLAFENLGIVKPISSMWKINLNINLIEFVELGLNLAQVANEIESKFKCMNETSGNCRPLLNLIHEKRKTAANNLKFIVSTKVPRRKRSIETLGNIIRGITGNLDQEDFKMFSEQIANLKAQQNEIVNQTLQEKQLVAETFQQVRETTIYVANFSAATQERFDKIYIRIKVIRAEREALQELVMLAQSYQHDVESVMELIATKKVTGKIITHDKLESSLSRIKAKLNPSQEFPFEDILEPVLQKEAKIVMHRNYLEVIVTIPVTTKEKWHLYKLHRFPVIGAATITMMEKNDEFMAADANGRTTSLKSTANCWTNFNEEKICSFLNQILQQQHECLSKALTSKIMDEALCAPLTHTAQIINNIVIRFDQSTLLVVPKSGVTFKAECENNENIESIITQNTMISSTRACVVIIDQSTFFLINSHETESMIHIKTEAEINIQEEVFKHHAIFPQMDKSRIEALDELGEHIKELNNKDLRTKFVQLNKSSENLQFQSVTAGGVMIVFMMILFLLVCCAIRR